MALLSNQQTADLCLKLATLLHAGLDLSQSARLIHPKEESVKQVVKRLAEESDQGLPLHEIMENTHAFPSYVTGLVETGYMSGKTEEALRALSVYYIRQEQRMKQIKAAITYPLMLLCMMVCVIGVLLVRVLPVFEDVYASLGGSMTGIAGRMLQAGVWIGTCMPILLGILAVLIAVVVVVCFSSGFRKKLVSWYQKQFGDRGIARKVNNAKLCQAISMGLEAGFPLDESMALASRLTVDVPAAADRCLSCARQLQKEVPMGEALMTSGIFSESSCELLYLGQQGGNADAAMLEITRRTTEEAEDAIDRLVARIEPALVLSASLLIGMILLSVMIPLMDIMSVIG